jgi:hypothetical protein
MKVQQKQRITPLQISRVSANAGRSSGSAPAFGPTTDRFFAEGEKHAANDWPDTIWPPDDEPTERVQSGSLDRVPRNRGDKVALTFLGICLGAGVGFGVRALLHGDNTVETATIDFATGGALRPSEAPVPPPPAPPAVAEQAAAGTEAALPPGLAAPHSPATSPDNEVNAVPEGPPAALAAPAPPETSAAAAMPADRKLRVDEGREPSQWEDKPTRLPRFALKTERRRAITPDLAEPRPGESREKSETPELKLDSWPKKALEPSAAGTFAPPRFGEPSIAPANKSAAAADNAPPAPEKLPAPTGDELADSAATAGPKHNPF